MYRKQQNKTAIRSQHMIADALFSLMKRKPFSEITVTELCAEAAIERKTFYRNFELREDVIDFKLETMLETYRCELARISPEKYLHHHLTYIQKNAELFAILYRNGFLPIANQKFSVLLPDVMPTWSNNSVEQEYRSAYIIGGIEAIQRIWISRGCIESIPEVIAVIQHIPCLGAE